MKKKPSLPVWAITVGGGYGTFLFRGTEEHAEKMRCHKANWEGAVARKRPATQEEIDSGKQITDSEF